MSRADILHFTPAAYLPKTRRLRLRERGAYSDLLFTMWTYSDEQCVFPLDYTALGGIWGVCPEEAMEICDILQAPGMMLMKVVKRKGIAHLFSKRLHEQKIAAERSRKAKAEAGRESGRVRRANAANTCSTDVQQTLNENEHTRDARPVSRTSRDLVLPVDPSITPVSSKSSESVRKGRGSYPQSSDEPGPAIAYWEGKLDHSLTPDELRSVKRWVRVYGSAATTVQIGYAAEDGKASNTTRIGGALKRGAASK